MKKDNKNKLKMKILKLRLNLFLNKKRKNCKKWIFNIKTIKNLVNVKK